MHSEKMTSAGARVDGGAEVGAGVLAIGAGVLVVGAGVLAMGAGVLAMGVGAGLGSDVVAVGRGCGGH